MAESTFVGRHSERRTIHPRPSLSAGRGTAGSRPGAMRCPACGTALLAAASIASVALAKSPPLSESFDESLLLRSLPDGKLHALFTFSLSTTAPASALTAQGLPNLSLRESGLFSLALAELVDRHGVEQFGASLSRGRWQSDRWGWPEDAATYPNQTRARGRPGGGEVWAWLDGRGGTDEIASAGLLDTPLAPTPLLRSWRGLTYALSGLLCSSLSELAQPSLTTFPPPSLHPRSDPSPSSSANITLVRGLLPIEHPCTENLSPLMTMLPCRSRAGLTALLDPHRLFEANWQSLALEVVSKGPRGVNGLEAVIEVDVVFDPVRRDYSAGGPGKRGARHRPKDLPWTCSH